jgi:Tfp pilus assembly protein PilN
MIPDALKRWIAFGSGVGIQISGPKGAESLHIAAVRVRPSGARVLGGFTVEDFPHQPAGVWGTDYAAFLSKLGLKHVAATVLLPRQDVILRQIALPGVADRDLANAVQFQLEGLHPYNEDDVATSWTRLGNTSTVLVAIARRESSERYANLFSEAGIRIGSFTCSAAAVYSALRLFGRKPASGILAYEPLETGGVEMYGESEARPVFSASFDVVATESAENTLERATALAAAELRLAPPSENAPEDAPRPLTELLGSTPALPYAAALDSACPRLSLPVNLLSAEHRQTSSPLLWVPSTALGAVVLLLAGGLAALPNFENRRYLQSVNAEMAKLQTVVARSAAIDKQIESAQQRIAVLDDLRRRPKGDMDVLAELTRLLPPPTWLNLMDLNARQVTVGGETDQAAPLLKTLDASPLFEASEFAMPPLRIAPQQGPGGTVIPGGEGFRIRTNREAQHP